MLRIVVWKEPDLTLDTTVRLDGMITLPLLGDVQAAGQGPGPLAARLVKEFERFVETPRVTVSVTQASARRRTGSLFMSSRSPGASVLKSPVTR